MVPKRALQSQMIEDGKALGFEGERLQQYVAERKDEVSKEAAKVRKDLRKLGKQQRKLEKRQRRSS